MDPISLAALVVSSSIAVKFFEEISSLLYRSKRTELLSSIQACVIEVEDKKTDIIESEHFSEANTNEYNHKLTQYLSTLCNEDSSNTTVTIIIDSKEKTRVIKFDNPTTFEVESITDFFAEKYSRDD
jgi:hypothetical protein